MPTPLVRARWFAPALLLAPLALAACSRPDTQSQLVAKQAAMDPPQLWRVQALAADGAVAKDLLVCTDTATRAGFERANAEVNGQTCAPRRDGVQREGVYANRCQLNGRWFGLTVNRAGDPQRDFTVAFALKALDGTGAGARQVRRFQRVGACPQGWGIGDQGPPGGGRVFNALSGTWGD
jgi:hypothetical protein